MSINDTISSSATNQILNSSSTIINSLPIVISMSANEHMHGKLNILSAITGTLLNKGGITNIRFLVISILVKDDETSAKGTLRVNTVAGDSIAIQGSAIIQFQTGITNLYIDNAQGAEISVQYVMGESI